MRLELDEDALRARAEQLAEAAQGLERDEELALEWVLTGGEDYSLLVTFPPQAELPEGFSRIGTVIASDADQPGVLTLGA